MMIYSSALMSNNAKPIASNAVIETEASVKLSVPLLEDMEDYKDVLGWILLAQMATNAKWNPARYSPLPWCQKEHVDMSCIATCASYA